MAEAVATKTAQLLQDALARKGKAAFIAATGASQFEFLQMLTAAPGIDWAKTTMFHLDEYLGKDWRQKAGGLATSIRVVQ